VQPEDLSLQSTSLLILSGRNLEQKLCSRKNKKDQIKMEARGKEQKQK
jgi:hypothetical protein